MKAANLTTEIEQWGSVETTVQKMFGTSRTSAAGKNSEQIADTDKSQGAAEEGVALEISDEAKKKYNEQMNVLEQLKRMQEENSRQSKKQAEEGDELGKVMTIFRRIANGDIVPWQDEKKLIEYNKEMYMAAKNIASLKENKEPKKYKSVDENRKNSSLEKPETFEASEDKDAVNSGGIAECF